MNPITIMSLLGGAYSAYQATQNTGPSWSDMQSQLNDTFSDSRGLIGLMRGKSDQLHGFGQKMSGRGDELWARGDDLWDPNSQINQNQYAHFTNQSEDAMAAALRQNARQNASGGVLGLSGGQRLAQNNAMSRDLQTGLGNNWMQYLDQARNQANQQYGMAQNSYGQAGTMYGQSASALGSALNAQSSLDSVYANAYITNQANQQQMQQAGWLGLSEGLFGAAGSGMGNLFGGSNTNDGTTINIS